MRKMMLKLSEVKENENHLVGNKAARLAFLAQKTIAVPEAIILTTQVFISFLKTTGLIFLHEALTQELSQPETLFLTEDLRRKILKLAFPLKTQEAVLKEFSKTKTEFFSVRSSATVEDSPSVSFAGIFETDLNLRRKNLLDGIKKCWASAFSPRVVFYARKKGVAINKIKMAVIIQKMIKGEKAGTLRTQNIIDGRKGESVIEAIRGLPNQVTSGLSNPERIFLDRKSRAVLKRQKNFTDDLVLEDKEAENLLKMGLQIEKYFSLPQEIEWAITQNKVFILQSRPTVA